MPSGTDIFLTNTRKSSSRMSVIILIKALPIRMLDSLLSFVTFTAQLSSSSFFRLSKSESTAKLYASRISGPSHLEIVLSKYDSVNSINDLSSFTSPFDTYVSSPHD